MNTLYAAGLWGRAYTDTVRECLGASQAYRDAYARRAAEIIKASRSPCVVEMMFGRLDAIADLRAGRLR